MISRVTFLLSLALCMHSTCSASIIAGIDVWDNTTAPTVPVTSSGVTATATASTSAGNWSISDSTGDPGRGSSVDTTWGTFATPAASSVTDMGTANFTVTNGRPSAEVTLTLVNNGTVDLDLQNFHMDVVAFRPNAPRTYALNVLAGSNVTVGNVFTSAAPMNDNSTNAITHLGGALGTGHDVHDDLDLSFGSLADSILEVGGTAIIQIAFSNGTGSGGGHHLFLDNVAIKAIPVPEPASLALLLCSLTALGLIRRRR